jgi:hypothetical protein
MNIVHAGTMPWGANLAAQRAGRMAHKRLFEGEEGSADNYLLVLANEGSDYYSPRHRHAWDQVRLCLSGAVPIGRELKIEAGEVGYFPEAVHYGPQEGGPDRIVLLLQFGGASGLGYLSPEQLTRGREALLREGVFEQGVFRRTDGVGKKNEDGYEAIWRCVTGRSLDYPKPRYRSPVIMRPAGFTWHPLSEQAGVRRKFLGIFPDRGLSLEFLAIEPGATCVIAPATQRRLLFVCAGHGRCGDTPYFEHSAVRLQPGHSAAFTAEGATELFSISVSLLTPHQEA